MGAESPDKELRALIAQTRRKQGLDPTARMSAARRVKDRQEAAAEAWVEFLKGFAWGVASLVCLGALAGAVAFAATPPFSLVVLASVLIGGGMFLGTMTLFTFETAAEHIDKASCKLRKARAKGRPDRTVASKALEKALRKLGRDFRLQEREDKLVSRVLQKLNKEGVFEGKSRGKQVESLLRREVVKVPDNVFLSGIIQSAVNSVKPRGADRVKVDSECATDLHRALNNCLFETRQEQIELYLAQREEERRLALQFSFVHGSSELCGSPIQLPDTNRSQLLSPNLRDIECLQEIAQSIDSASAQADSCLLFHGLVFWSSVGLVTVLEEFVSHPDPADQRESATAARACWDVFERVFAKIEEESFNCAILQCPIDKGETEEDRVAARVPNGDYYSRRNIEKWLKKHTTDPMSREPLAKRQLSDAPEYDVALKFWRQLQV